MMEQDQVVRSPLADRLSTFIILITILCTFACLYMGNTYTKMVAKYQDISVEYQKALLQIDQLRTQLKNTNTAPSSNVDSVDLKPQKGDKVAVFKKLPPQPIKKVENAQGKFASVFYFGEYSSQQLLQIRALLTELRKNDVCATFIFEAGSYTHEPKVFWQIRHHCHEVGFSDKLPAWAQNNSPILATAEIDGVNLNGHPYINPTQQLDTPNISKEQIVEKILTTTAGDILRFGGLNFNPHTIYALGKALPKLGERKLQSVTVGELVSASSRRDGSYSGAKFALLR